VKRYCCVFVLLLAGGSSDQRPSQSFKFTFRPPDSTSFVVELSMVRTSSQGDQQMEDSTWTRTGHVQVAVPGGFELTGRTDSVAVFRNRIAVNDPIILLFSGGDITYVIDSTGLAREVRGYTELMDRLDQLVGPDTAAMVREMVTPEALQQEEIATWNAKFANFVDREMVLGEAYCDTAFPVLPVEGRLAAYVISEIIDTVRLDGRLCGRVRVTSSTDPSEVARLSERTDSDIGELFTLAEEAFTQARLRQAGISSIREWVLEFETMLTHSDSSREEAFYHQLTSSGVPVRSQISEVQTKHFIYPVTSEAGSM